MMKNTKTVAVSTVLSDRLEAIAYNIAGTYTIAATAQIQPSMSEPAAAPPGAKLTREVILLICVPGNGARKYAADGDVDV